MASILLATTAAVVVALGSVSFKRKKPPKPERFNKVHNNASLQSLRRECIFDRKRNGGQHCPARHCSRSTGLEAGDRILEINGRQVRSVGELQACLSEAANFRNGQVRVLVENVRGRYGLPGEQLFVTVSTYLDGFAGLAGSNPVPVYAAPAGQPL